MCTAISWKCGSHFFGRTLDLEKAHGEEVIVVPRHFPLHFRRAGKMEVHYAMIGIAVAADGYPLFFDAANERGLCMAALNFPENAVYMPPADSQGRIQDIAPFEFIPWILGRCASVREARDLLARTRAADISFSDTYPLTPLHWILADSAETLVIEPGEAGLALYENPAGVLTNNPPFPMQMFHLQQFRRLSAVDPLPSFGAEIPFAEYSRGLGSIGLPGDFTSPSRFVRAAFLRANLSVGNESHLSAFFHMMDAVAVPRGCVRLRDGGEVITRYTSCWDGESETYSSTVYENRQISSVKLRAHDLDCAEMIRYPLYTPESVHPVKRANHS
ncbi:MAG: choloylglycine hydrolase family protein [Ruminococcaceae bacterium]|nr:choloylglycine hydrolase family protein [Oscillospiraceae bacterium]